MGARSGSTVTTNLQAPKAAGPDPEQLARPVAPAAPAPPAAPAAAPTNPAATKPKPNATDRVLIACPFCPDCTNTKLVPEKGKGLDWTRAECNNCGRMFKVHDRDIKPGA